MSSKCPVCESNKTVVFKENVSGSPEVYALRCSKCTLEFLNIWDDELLVNSFYKDLKVVYESDIENEPIKHNEYDRRYNEVLPLVNSKSRLLEIGAGQGHFLDRISPFVFEAHALEISPLHIDLLRNKGYFVYDKPLTDLEPKSPYDIVCLYAVLEHVPKIKHFLEHLKNWIHQETILFFEMPNAMEPLLRFYDVPEYRNFFYREYHLYTFSESTIQLLFNELGFECKLWPLQVASITNHFHWLHEGKGQQSMNDMVNVTLPKKLINEETPKGDDFLSLLDKVDDFYRKTLENSGVGDILLCQAKMKKQSG